MRLGRLKKVSSSILERNAAVIVAPHADDEVIGCGGWMLASSAPLRVVVCTDSGHQRNKELAAAMARSVGQNYCALGLPDGQAWDQSDCETAATRIAAEANDIFADVLFVPNRADPHRDHQSARRVVAQALAQITRAPEIVEYEGLEPLQCPNWYLDLTQLQTQKSDLIRCYQSQDHRYRLVDVIGHLNAYRGLTLLRRSVTSAECYRRQSAEEFLNAASS